MDVVHSGKGGINMDRVIISKTETKSKVDVVDLEVYSNSNGRVSPTVPEETLFVNYNGKHMAVESVGFNTYTGAKYMTSGLVIG